MRLNYLLYLLLFGCTFYTPKTSVAQEKKRYTGPMQIGTYKGAAMYDYYLKNTDTIYDGSFKVADANLENLLDDADHSFSIAGNFVENDPTGNWTFRFNEFQSNKSSSVEAYKYVLKVDGRQKFASGVLKKGKPDGEWVCAVQQIKNSKISTTDFKSSLSFIGGIPQQSFTIQSQSKELVGRFLRNGVAHDAWTLYTDEALDPVEIWHFNEGILEDIQFRNGETTLKTEIYARDFDEVKTISLDRDYLAILKVKLPEEQYSQLSQSSIINLLEQNDTFYKDIQMLLSEFTTASFAPEVKVKVPYFALSKAEKVRLDSISNLYEQSKKISNTLLENTELNILKIADQKVRSLEETVALVTSEVLGPLAQLSSFFKNGTLAFFTRKEFLSKIWSQKKVTIVPGIAAQAIENAKIKTLVDTEQLAQQTKYYLDSIQQILTKNITTQKREEEAIALEEKMIEQVAYLETLQNTLEVDSIAPTFAHTLGKIKKDTAEKLRTYVGMQNATAKQEYARELVHCFEKLDQVGATIKKLPAQQYALQSKYKDAIWNPFTATIMEESVKKRLLTAYNTVLIPYFLKQIEGGLACEDTEQWILLLNATYDRMLELRNENTRKLERKLRRETDPLVVLQRLQIKPQMSDN